MKERTGQVERTKALTRIRRGGGEGAEKMMEKETKGYTDMKRGKKMEHFFNS